MRLGDQGGLVTGSARGIGKAIVERFAAEGAVVVIRDVANETAARETLAGLEKNGSKGRVEMFDVGDAAQVDAAVANILAAQGRIDILVNNAGITRNNLKGTFLLTKAVSRHMIKQRGGRIINMSSVVGLMGNAGQSNYSAAKAGIAGFTKSMARELGSRGITVNAIAP